MLLAVSSTLTLIMAAARMARAAKAAARMTTCTTSRPLSPWRRARRVSRVAGDTAPISAAVHIRICVSTVIPSVSAHQDAAEGGEGQKECEADRDQAAGGRDGQGVAALTALDGGKAARLERVGEGDERCLDTRTVVLGELCA